MNTYAADKRVHSFAPCGWSLSGVLALDINVE